MPNVRRTGTDEMRRMQDSIRSVRSLPGGPSPGWEGFFTADTFPCAGEDMGSSLQRQVSRVNTRDYDRVSRVWDGTFVPATDRIRRHILDLAELHPGERVLDVGTGTGAAALLAARRVGTTGRVLGIDMSPAMLAKARAKASRSGLTNVTFRRMDASALRLPKESLDVILSSFGTPEGLVDGAAVFRDWIRVLRPGGRLCFAENPGIRSSFQPMRRVLEKYKVKAPSSSLASRRRLWEKANKALDRTPTIDGDAPRRVARLMRAAGFRDVRVSHQRSRAPMPDAQTVLRLFLNWTSAEEYAEMRPEVRAAFRADLLRAIHRYETPEGVRLPTQTNFFFGRKPGRGR